MGPPGALRRLPDVPHRAARRACPAGPLAPMKGVNIKDLWYYSLALASAMIQSRNAAIFGSWKRPREQKR